MWVIVTRCAEPQQAVYASLLASLLRRGALPVDGEWGRSIVALHGPPYPSLRHGSGKRVSARLSREENGLTRVEVVIETRLGDVYALAAAALALLAPLAGVAGLQYSLPLGLAAAASGVAATLTTSIDANWASSLAEEACLEAPSYRDMVSQEPRCSVECGEARGGYACTIAPLGAQEVLGAALAILGFSVRRGRAETQTLSVRFTCSPSSCTLLFRPRRLYPRPNIYTAILVSMLAARLAC